MASRGRSLGGLLLVSLVVVACEEPTRATDTPPSTGLTPLSAALENDPLLDPATCRDCHSTHVGEWEASMHAYAAADPVFLAMERRGQRETDGALGDFCVRCHAPLAVATGKVTRGDELDNVPEHLHGVTCYACHAANDVGAAHNNGLIRKDDGVMRGPLSDPSPTSAHGSAYGSFQDQRTDASALMCGSCHDVVNQHGFAVETTYKEWLASIYGQRGESFRLTCGQCHMPGRNAPAHDAPGARVRRTHDHTMVGIDQAAAPWPGQDAAAEAIQRKLDGTIDSYMCVTRSGDDFYASFRFENAGAGHTWPSGAGHNRRAWLEVRAYSTDANGDETLTYSSGVIDDDAAIVDSIATDPALALFRDELKDGPEEDAHPVHMMWEAKGVYNTRVPSPAPAGPVALGGLPHGRFRFYLLGSEKPSRVEIAMKARAIGVEILQDLVDSGDLAPEDLPPNKTWTLGGSHRVWTADPSVPKDSDADLNCVPALPNP